MMMFDETTKSLFTSDLFIQPGNSKPVISEDMSEAMLALYRGTGIFANEQPVRQTVKKLERMKPDMVYPMHGSCFAGSLFPLYADALMKNDFAFAGLLLGKQLDAG